MSFAQAIRTAAIAVSGGAVVLSAVTFYYYSIVYRRDPGRGLLPVHVLLVTLYAVLKSVTDAGIIFHLLKEDEPLTFIGPTIFFAQVILIVSLVVILRFEKRRYNAATVRELKNGNGRQ